MAAIVMRPVGKYSRILRIAVRGVCGLLAMRRETHGMVRSWHEGAPSVVPWKIRLPRCCGSAKAHGAGAGLLPLTPNRLLLALKSCDVAPLASLLTEALRRRMPAHACLVLLNCFEAVVQRTNLIRLLFGYRGRISRSQFWMAAALVITRLLLRCQTSSAEQVS
jgi:hypothetical protein